VQIDRTPDSYFQYVVLAVLGNQYYLSWHANYNDTHILCDQGDNKYVEAEFTGMNIPDFSLPQNVQDAAKTIDYQPLVLVGDKTVTVRLVTFSKWGGYTEEIFVVDKQNPEKLISVKKNVMIVVQVGMVF
jgi:hypothetical protein